MSLVGVNGQPLSARKVRTSVEQQQIAMRLLTTAFSAFLNLTLWGRVKWLCFGANAFKPTASLAEQFKAERDAIEERDAS
jgi:hypothetical protein